MVLGIKNPKTPNFLRMNPFITVKQLNFKFKNGTVKIIFETIVFPITLKRNKVLQKFQWISAP